MSEIRYVQGDATQPIGDGPKIIAHICNDRGGWGRGFVAAISRRWRQPQHMYRDWAAGSRGRFELGLLQLVDVDRKLWVANILAQEGYSSPDKPAIRYDALRSALTILRARAHVLVAAVHMPRIGCGLAGGTWDKVEPIIQETLIAEDVDVTVYDL